MTDNNNNGKTTTKISIDIQQPNCHDCPPATYHVTTTKEDDGAYSGKCIELPGAVSQGKSIEELQVNMRAAIQSIVKSYDHA
jgi:predicted RNase H-like HicB family nuclease